MLAEMLSVSLDYVRHGAAISLGTARHPDSDLFGAVPASPGPPPCFAEGKSSRAPPARRIDRPVLVVPMWFQFESNKPSRTKEISRKLRQFAPT
jgi:hypothetical protein